MVMAPTSARRKALERVWVAAGVGYGIARVFLANATVRRYGVNIAAFAVIEIGSSFPYSLGTARLVGAIVDRKMTSAVRWGVVAALCFIAPEAFIVATGHGMPRSVYYVIAAVVSVLGTLAVVGVVRKVRRSRRERVPAASSAER
jgi:hypothetical protein